MDGSWQYRYGNTPYLLKCNPQNELCFSQLCYQLLSQYIEVERIKLLQQFSQHNSQYYSHGIAPQEFPWSLNWYLEKILLSETFSLSGI